MRVNKNNIDVSRAFIVYVTLVGDVEKTAAALDLDPAVVRQLATDEGWHEKVSRISVQSKSGKPGDFEKGVNRALNFAQAHRVRLVLDKVIERFEGMTPEEVINEVTARTASGASSISARFFADLTSAMEKAAHLSYLALGDTAGERPDASTDEAEFTANQMHQAVIQALNNPSMRSVPQKLLIEEQAQVCQNVPPVTEIVPLCPTHADERKSLPETPAESQCAPPGSDSVG